LKGNLYECCRTEGHCPLWFGRDMWDAPCVNFATYQIEEGYIGDVDMKGVTIIHHQDGIGPTFAEHLKGVREGAVYISDNATDEQRKALEPFVKSALGAGNWGTFLGLKYVPVSVSGDGKTFDIVMPYGEQHMTLTTGGDGQTPITMGNSWNTAAQEIKFANTDLWTFKDYGKDITLKNTSGVAAKFAVQG
ncbi:MAG: DUF1326 domain-containing protein, partial [Armatimonadetes bacterium]|nr:DUF1326 domain-containing protein [Armatimonadota bacterium]